MNMEVKSKYKVGDTVYFPSEKLSVEIARKRNPCVKCGGRVFFKPLKNDIKEILFSVSDNSQITVSYKFDSVYRDIKESDIFEDSPCGYDMCMERCYELNKKYC